MPSDQRHRCEECGGELTCCGPMTEDGPLLDCLLCQRSEIITKLKAQLAASEEKRLLLVAEVLSGRNKETAHHEYDCQYVGCIEKSQCPAWSAEKDYEAAKEATDAAKAMEG